MEKFGLISLLFCIGCVLGSFFTLIGMRIPKKESIVSPRSHCDQCGTSLGIPDLLPIVSFILFKGSCRHCKTRLSLLYPLMECLCGTALTVSIMSTSGQPDQTFLLLLLISFGVVFTVSDYLYLLLPDSIMSWFLVLSLLYRMVFSPFQFSYLISGAAAFLFFYAVYHLFPNGMGGGDVKLIGIIGFLLGFQQTLLTVFLASFLGLAAVYLPILKSEKNKRMHLPFGPFLFLGAFATVFLSTIFVSPL